METHVKVLGVLHIAFGSIFLALALFFGLAAGTASGIVGATAEPHDAAVALPIIGLVGTALVVFLILTSLPAIVTGIGLVQFRPWARIMGIVLSAIDLLHIPFGTILGIYGLWVLLNKDTERLFHRTTAVVIPQTPSVP